MKPFDLEEYYTAYIDGRDAYLKAAKEFKLATGPYKTAQEAYVDVTTTYAKLL